MPQSLMRQSPSWGPTLSRSLALPLPHLLLLRTPWDPVE